MKKTFLKVSLNGLEVKELEDSLSVFYNELKCDYIDITTRKIGGKYYDIICDDEGLLKPNFVSAVSRDLKPMLVGNLLICNCADENGDLVGLEEADIENINSNLMYVFQKDTFMPVVIAEFYRN